MFIMGLKKLNKIAVNIAEKKYLLKKINLT